MFAPRLSQFGKPKNFGSQSLYQTASEDVHTSSQIVFEVRTVKWILLLEIEDSNSYDRQIFGFGWDDLDGFAYRMDVHSRSFEDGESETGVKLTAGFNYYRRKSCGC